MSSKTTINDNIDNDEQQQLKLNELQKWVTPTIYEWLKEGDVEANKLKEEMEEQGTDLVTNLFTNDDELAKAIGEIRNHGQSKRYTHTRLGYNSRLDTLQAAILLEKLKIFPNEVADCPSLAYALTHYFLQHLPSKLPLVRLGCKC